MAVLDVESGFDHWAVSSAGAVGLMQVMPFWPERLGMKRYELTHIEPNLHMGCAILRFYLDAERRDVRSRRSRARSGQDVLNPRGHSSAANSTLSIFTSATLAADGPIHSHLMNSSTAASSPHARTSTVPSARFRAYPVTAVRSACRCALPR
jgi:hypothetical protein